MRVCGPIAAAVAILLLLEWPRDVEGILRRCVKCRSRGELGSCKDPFTMNATQIENETGVETVPCASGWCGKVIEGQSINNEHGTATERMCLQSPPNDNEERCAYITKDYKKVYMCFCNGDLCNSATKTAILPALCLLAIVGVMMRWL